MLSNKYKKMFLFGLALCLVLLAALGIFHDTLAGWVTDINTNDGLIDPNWGGAKFVDSINDDTIEDVLEIHRAWIRNNGTYLYFRIETYGQPAISSGSGVVAVLDCNSDGDGLDLDDRKVFFNPNAPYLQIYNGENVNMGGLCVPGNPPDCIDAERVEATPNDFNLEWRWPYFEDPNFPVGCKDDIQVSWATVNGTTLDVWDLTSFFIYNVPTAIELEKLQAVSGSQLSKPLLALLGISLVFGVSGVILVFRNKGKKSPE